MARPAPSELDEATVPVPGSVRFPVELTPPDSFDPDDEATWPRVDGRLEWVAGRLLYMPPCGDRQQLTVFDVVTTLGMWLREHPTFTGGTNEAGLRLGDDTRGADGAIWRAADLPPITGGYVHVPPILAVEVGGRCDSESTMREKARWYLAHGVRVVWLLLPEERVVLVLTTAGETRHGTGQQVASHPDLPELAPTVDELFWQVSRAGKRAGE